MIVGFSHLMIGCQWGGGFLTFKNVPSSPHKWGLTERQPKSHDLVVNFPSTFPIELVRYDTGFVRGLSSISVADNDTIRVCAKDTSAEKEFFSKIGTIDRSVVVVNSAIRRYNINILISKRDHYPIDHPIDIAGYQAVAFYTSNIENDRNMLIDSGGRSETPIWRVTVGERDMDVCMMRSPGGTPIELVQVVI